MKAAIVMLMAVVGACSSSSSSGSSGPQECVEAGGQCIIGSNPCPNKGPQNCNPNSTPAGQICCLPCPSPTKPNDAGTACE
jgi:hypothetical protein